MRSTSSIRFAALLCGVFVASSAFAEQPQAVLIETESFEEPGGWKLDTQSIDEMGSAYLLAHGLGRPVEDAVHTLPGDRLPAGEITAWVRTKDWVARWNAEGTPGRFQLLVGGTPLQAELGTVGKEWGWHQAGTFTHDGRSDLELRLRDLTGLDGRADAIYLTAGTGEALETERDGVDRRWRRRLAGLPDQRTLREGYDLVVVGGGYSGMGAAISAARMGCKVALIQNRGVLGGNGSSEVRVWSMGLIRRGRFPRLGEIVAEFADEASKSPGQAEEFGDELKERIVRAEPNIELFLHTHAFGVERGEPVPVEVPTTTDGSGEDTRTERQRPITGVVTLNVRTGEESLVRGRLFCDATGHGTIGALAEAQWDMTATGRMGMSNMWRWDEAAEPTSFPETPWALQLSMDDFPYPRDHHGQWFWESGFDKDAIGDAEGIRDWNLRAVYGAFHAMKNGDGAADHANAVLTWVAYIGGPRESRRLLGDVLLTQDDIVSKREFDDGTVPSTWSIDLHYPKQQYAGTYPDNPFISVAKHDRRIDRTYGYPVPYRCFYSRSIPNLFMAGRCISVTHEALGTVRVMRTCGMMGEVVGRAASICVDRECGPREVYTQHLDELVKLLRLPGKARRADVQSEIVVPDDAMPLAPAEGPPPGLIPSAIAGRVVDDRQAESSGKWTEGQGLRPFVGYGYRYLPRGQAGWMRFSFRDVPPGRYEVQVATRPHENRATATPVVIAAGVERRETTLDQTAEPAVEGLWATVGTIAPQQAELVQVTIQSDESGTVHADAVRLLPASTPAGE